MWRDLARMGALDALPKVGATEEETDRILANNEMLDEIPTWANIQMWARSALVRLRAQGADDQIN